LINQCLKDKKPFYYEARIITENKKEKAIYAEGKAMLNDRNEVIKMFGITQDITKRKEAEEALKTYNAELKKSNHELDRFVYSASHDLRAPLLSMQGIVDLTEDMTDEELTAEHMRMLRGSIRKLDGFIAEILNYSRNARMEVKADKVDFEKMLKDISSNLQYMNGVTNQVNISYNINENGTFYSDKGRISVLLNNLISNSIRYYNPNTENPYVKISVVTNEKKAEIKVEDNGIGISEEYHQKIFEMFYRVSENSSGSGLGLYIVKETIDKMKGDIEIDSRAEKGTSFHITIPNLFYQ
jgi:signal transduction histidine kinase